MKRNHEIHVAGDGLVTIVGGKLTTSRHMAEQTVDAVEKLLGRRTRCTTASAFLLGAAGYDAQAITATGGLSAHLGERYGTEARFVSDILDAHPALARPIVEGLPHTEAEVVYAARHEMARTVEDVLSRRMRARLMARDASARAAARVGDILAQELGLAPAQIAQQIHDYRRAMGAKTDFDGRHPMLSKDAIARGYNRRNYVVGAPRPGLGGAGRTRSRPPCLRRSCLRPAARARGRARGRARRAARRLRPRADRARRHRCRHARLVGPHHGGRDLGPPGHAAGRHRPCIHRGAGAGRDAHCR